MNLLLDTNVFLEVLLGQTQAKEAASLLSNAGRFHLFITDFSLHSIGILLFRRRCFDVFAAFSADLAITGVRMLSLQPQEITALSGPAARYNLDFDDAYQYELAKRFNLTLVSFDSDFDRTDCGRRTPQEILAHGD